MRILPYPECTHLCLTPFTKLTQFTQGVPLRCHYAHLIWRHSDVYNGSHELIVKYVLLSHALWRGRTEAHTCTGRHFRSLVYALLLPTSAGVFFKGSEKVPGLSSLKLDWNSLSMPMPSPAGVNQESGGKRLRLDNDCRSKERWKVYEEHAILYLTRIQEKKLNGAEPRMPSPFRDII